MFDRTKFLGYANLGLGIPLVATACDKLVIYQLVVGITCIFIGAYLLSTEKGE